MKALRRTRKPSPSTIVLFLICLFILRAEPLALTPSPYLTVPNNLSEVWSYRHCVSDPSWNPRIWHIASDCENALVDLADESSHWGLYPGTFTYNPGGQSTAEFPGAPSRLTLPKRYVRGNCVIAITMMKMFERSSTGQFPGLPDSLIGKWRSKDTSTWKSLIEPAEYVRATCDNGCGYAVLGRDVSIGVAIWGTGSKWDRYARELSQSSESDNWQHFWCRAGKWICFGGIAFRSVREDQVQNLRRC